MAGTPCRSLVVLICLAACAVTEQPPGASPTAIDRHMTAASTRSAPADRSAPAVGSTPVPPSTTSPGAEVRPDAEAKPRRQPDVSTVGSTSTSPPASEPTAPEPTTTEPTTTDRVAPTRRLTMAFVGDVLAHSPLWRQAERNGSDGSLDFRPMFADIRTPISAVDVAVCHLETPFAPAGTEYTTHPLYGVPTEVADALAWSGFDRCSTASNHTLDRGVAGIATTIEALEDVGIDQSGMARTPAEIKPRVVTVSDVAFSHLSYTFSYNGLRTPDDEPWRSALIDADRIVADARAARDLGADAVIVSMHWGNEGVTEPSWWQREVAEEITATGLIDLVVGHHAHVVQPIEQINGTWVAFGLGNILSNLPTASFPAHSQDGAILRVAVAVDDGVLSVERPVVIPTWVDIDRGWVIRDVGAALADADLTAGARDVLMRSLDRTADVVGDFIGA